jgi:branched-chain amino acid transport system ATP-binding protein
LLAVRDVSVRFGGIVALDHVSFEQRRGEILGLIGPNGAGKTTLLFEGAGILGRPAHRIAEIGIGRTFHVPEGRGTFVRLTVEENLLLGAMTRRERAAVADDLARIYGFFPVLQERRRQQAAARRAARPRR